jgi:hypothetical protein
MAYYVGDIPSEVIVIEPARGEEFIPLTGFTVGSTIVQLRTFDGDLVPATFGVTFDTDDADEIDKVKLTWPTAATVLAEAGIHTIAVTLVGATKRERLAPVPVVVQTEDGWHTVDTARLEWSDATGIDDVRLYTLLELARAQCTEYAPALPANTRPPINYRQAQLMQARNLINAGRAEGEGEGDFVLRPFPLDWMVKQTLRPKSGVPVVG